MCLIRWFLIGPFGQSQTGHCARGHVEPRGRRRVSHDPLENESHLMAIAFWHNGWTEEDCASQFLNLCSAESDFSPQATF